MRLAMNRKQIKKVQRKLMLYIILAAGFFGVNHIDCLSRLNQQFFFFPEVSKESEIGESIAAISPEVLIEEINETEVSDAPEPIGYICIQAGKLNVRETPNGTILGTVSQGETHDYFEEESGWLKIAYGEGEGYVCGKYGDIYDTNGDLVKPAGTSIQKSATAEPVQTDRYWKPYRRNPQRKSRCRKYLHRQFRRIRKKCQNRSYVSGWYHRLSRRTWMILIRCVP